MSTRFVITTTVVAVAVAASAGCQEQKRLHFVPTSPALRWHDLAGSLPVEVDDGFRLVIQERTQGVFPASVAVARVAAPPDGEAAGPLTLDMKPDVDFLSWNSVFDDFRSVSEVFPINVMALNGADVNIASLIDAATAEEAGMLLVYTETHSSVHRSDILGVLYQIPSGRVLASVHASADIESPIDLDDEEDAKLPSAEREARDPRLHSRRTFETAARGCLLAMMAQDDPVEPVAPEGWIPEQPFGPILWPPSEDMFFRRRQIPTD